MIEISVGLFECVLNEFECRVECCAYFTVVVVYYTTDETYTDAELARVSVLTFHITKTAYVSPVASVWQVSRKILIRK